MTIESVITLLGGVALFLFGMNIMGSGLEKMSGGRLERILERLTSNKFKAVLLGAAVTGVIQSSSATTVMLVGFVNAGIMKLGQVVGVIMGANIGTTVTSMLLSLGDIDDSASFVLKLFKPAALAPLVSVIGILFYMFTKRGKRHDVGQILLGFGVLFFGMLTMESAMKGLAGNDGFISLMTAFSNPLLGVLAGTILTAVIQSSSASVGILQALSASNALPFSAAAPIIMGQNIGTCVTALLSSIGASRNAKRTALIHLYFNIIGTAVFLAALYGLQGVFEWSFWNETMSRGTIAVFHLTFNMTTTMLLLPFSNMLVRLAAATLRGGDSESTEMDSMLDARFLSSPSVALNRALDAVALMMERAQRNFRASAALLDKYDEKAFNRIREVENVLDRLEVHINQYLLKLTDRDLTQSENLLHSELLHTIGDIERIGDYSINIAELAQDKDARNIQFSVSAYAELGVMVQAVSDLIHLTREAYLRTDKQSAVRIEPLEETIDRMTDILKNRHIERLKKNACDAESGAQYLELLINFERIADHCSNVGLYIIQRNMPRERRSNFDMHAYVRHLHAGETEEYNKAFEDYEQVYVGALNEIDADGRQTTAEP